MKVWSVMKFVKLYGEPRQGNKMNYERYIIHFSYVPDLINDI